MRDYSGLLGLLGRLGSPALGSNGLEDSLGLSSLTVVHLFSLLQATFMKALSLAGCTSLWQSGLRCSVDALGIEIPFKKVL